MLDDLVNGALKHYKWNREIDGRRVERIVADQVAAHQARGALDAFSPSPIHIASMGGECFLVDGQHRLAAFGELAARGLADGVAMIAVTTACASEMEIDDLFQRINVGTPVPAAYYDRLVHEVLSAFAERLAAAYPLAVAITASPIRPRFRVDAVIRDMSANQALRDGIKDKTITADAIWAAAERENEFQKQILQADHHIDKPPPKCIAAAIRSNFYLGLEKQWPATIAIRLTSD